jgi:hypothetical protein
MKESKAEVKFFWQNSWQRRGMILLEGISQAHGCFWNKGGRKTATGFYFTSESTAGHGGKRQHAIGRQFCVSSSRIKAQLPRRVDVAVAANILARIMASLEVGEEIVEKSHQAPLSSAGMLAITIGLAEERHVTARM